MVYSYYPGCTLKTKAKDLDKYARLCAEALGFKLNEIENWQCCGAVYPMGVDEVSTKLASVRTLNAAKESNQELVTLCSACHHVIKRVNDDMKNYKDTRTKVNNYLNINYAGETSVLHFIEVLHKKIGFDKLKEKVKNPLKGRKIGAYYGCMLLRPSNILEFDDPESPTVLESFIKVLGGDPVLFPYRNECCGGYISLKEKALSGEMTNNVMSDAIFYEAEELITACPLCLYNLKNVGNGEKLPVYYFTELLAEALGLKEE